ncbi:MAG: tubulin/FtsZ family protein [Candidatus Hydrothermarchaeales archaeon]
MKVFMIGLGQAGGKIIDLFVEDDMNSRTESIYKAVVVNTARPDLKGLKHVPKKNRVLIGETIVGGHGVGANNKLGARIAKAEIDKILTAIDLAGTGDIDVFLIVLGFGGGTGSGAAPIVVKHIKRIFNEPVYVLGVLPTATEGGVYLLNSARSLKTLSKYADSMILVDNSAFLKPGESLKDAYKWINSEIVKRFGLLAKAGEVGVSGVVGEMVVDASEINQTLTGMEICTIGYATEELPKAGFLKKTLVGEDKIDQRKSARIVSLITRAAKTRLLMPCDFRSVRRALIVVAGPPEELSRDGTESAREWLAKNIAGGEVRGGDFPVPNSKYMAAVVLLAGVTGVHRLDALFEKARAMQEAMARGLTTEETKKREKTSQLMADIEDLEEEEIDIEDIEDLLKDLEM